MTFIVQDNVSEHHCAKVTIYKDFGVDTKGNLIDFAFCEVDKGYVVTNKACESNISIKDVKWRLGHEAESIISVQKVGRTTGLTVGQMRNSMRNIKVTDANKEMKGKMLIVNGFFGKSLFTKLPFQLALLFLIINCYV